VTVRFHDAQKLACLERELGMRCGLYPRRIRQGLMTADKAALEIALIEEIIADYRAKLQPTLDLESPDGSQPMSPGSRR
jgi:hypothetical protein